MDLKYSPEDEAFRLEVREWLEANVPDRLRHTASLRNRVPKKDRVPFYHLLRERGWMAPGWPKEHGGAGFTLPRRIIFNEEMNRVGAPTLDAGVSMAGPLIIEFGTPEQKARFLPKIVAAEELWCQGYSEPNAGSDLAALATRAEVDGDDFVLNGQKIWTSVAFESDWMFILVRTDPHAEKKQTGISFLLMDMKSPGVTVNQIDQISGENDFCEVFMNDVRVPRSNLVGEINRGWGHAKQLLEFERTGSYSNYPLHRTVNRLIEHARNESNGDSGSLADSDIRRRLAQALMDSDATVYLGYRTLTRTLRGEPQGPESSVIKLFASEALQRIGQIAVDVQGPKAQIWFDPNFSGADNDWPVVEITSRSLTIARGTSEIQRNIIAERVLGMPR